MKAESKKTRVVAYARVSTKAQVIDGNSLENQRTYFQRELSKNKDFTLVSLPTNDTGIYADEGVSGTKLKRPAFMRMLNDAGLKPVISARTDEETDDYEIVGKPLFDLIFVKDTTRFARNVSVDKLLKTLNQNGVTVYFLDLNKRTDNNEDMTYIQIFLSFGERESRDRSVKVKFGKAERRRQGDITIGGKIYGYNYVKINKKDRTQGNYLEIDEEEAKIVRMIYDLYTEECYGDFRICQILYDKGYRNRNGNKFTTNTIARILKNEKYTGTNDAGKYTYKDMFKRRVSEVSYDDADRESARIATKKLEESGIIKIPAIISREQFDKAQAIRQAHCDHNKVVKCKYNGKTPFAHKVKCAECGSYYIANSAKRYKNADGTEGRYVRRYACKHHTHYNGDTVKQCNNPTVKETDLIDALMSDQYTEVKLSQYEDVAGACELCIVALQDAINKPNDAKASVLKERREALSEKKQKLLELYLDGAYTKDELDSFAKKIDEDIRTLDSQIELATKNNDEIREMIKLVSEIFEDVNVESARIKNQNLTSLDEIVYKKRLREIDAMYIDAFGSISLTFKNTTDLERVSAYLDSIRKAYDKEVIEDETASEISGKANSKALKNFDF